MKTVVSNLDQYGLITDKDAHNTPINAWTNLSNIRCKRERIEPMDGTNDITALTNAGTPVEDIYVHSLNSLSNNTAFYWVFPYDLDGDGLAEKIYFYDGSPTTGENITRQISAADVDYTGTSTDLWDTCQFNGIVIFNNGVDNPQYWTGTGKCLPIPYDSTGGIKVWAACDVSETEFDTDGAGGVNSYYAKVIRPFKDYLFALNITEASTNYYQMVHWSNKADPGSPPDSWDYTSAANEAGRTMLAETDGRIVDAKTLGDVLFIYKEDAIYRCSFIGGVFVFGFDLITTSHGLYSTNCVVDIGGAHVCLGDGVVYIHSGGEIKNILEGRAADQLFDNIDTTNYEKTFLFKNKTEQEVWICYPETGSTWANKALIWNYGTDIWYSRDLPLCSTIKSGIVSVTTSPLWSDYPTTTYNEIDRNWVQREFSPIGDTPVAASKQLTQFEYNKTANTVYAQKSDILIDTIDTRIMIKEVIPHATGDAFTVEVGTQKFIGGTITWEASKTFTPGTTRKLSFRASGPIVAIRFSGTGDWRISDYTVDLVTMGTR